MADDITLTVRVRDLTRGEFEGIRRRMRGMDGDIRHLGQTSNMTSDRANRLGREIHGVSGRLGEMSRNGNTARHEMTHMSRTMGILGRDLRNARNAGELSRQEFQRLSHQLSETRVAYDRLTRDVDRHSAVARRAARDEANAARAVQTMGRLQAAALRENERRDAARLRSIQTMGRTQAAAIRENERRDAARLRSIQTMGRLQAAALREEANRQAAAARDEQRRQMTAGQLLVNQRRRLLRAETAAYREEARRQAEAARAARAGRLTALRDEDRIIRQFRASQADSGLTRRFRGANIGDDHAMVRSLRNLRSLMDSASNSSDSARHHINLFNRDTAAMAAILNRARQAGHISRQDFDSLSHGVNTASNNLRTLGRNGTLTRDELRSMQRELRTLRSHLTGLNRDGNVFNRLHGSLAVLQRRLHTAARDGNLFRRSFMRIGEGLTAGLRTSMPLMARMLGLMQRFGNVLRVNKTWTAILIGVLLLLGPIAQALGALLVTALGGAFIALGAFALRGSAEVRGAFTQMKATIGTVLRQSAIPLQGALVEGMMQVGVAAQRIKPALTAAFTAAAPLVKDLFGALTDLGQKAMPGIIDALEHSKGAMAGFRVAMGDLGQGLGQMFQIITSGNEEDLARAWSTLGEELRNLLESLGQFISTSLKSGTASMMMIGVFRLFTGVLNLVAAALQAVDAVFGDLFVHIADGISGFKGLGDAIDNSFKYSGRSVGSMKKELADVETKLKEIRDSTSNIPGPAKNIARKDQGYDALLAKRQGLLAAITAAEKSAGDAVADEARSYEDLVTAMQKLAELNRNYLDAQAAQQKAILDAKEKQKDFKHALKMSGGQLDLTTKSGIDAYQMLSEIARNTQEATTKAEAAHAPWAKISKNWQDGYNNIVALGDSMGLSAEDARALATQILGIPPSKDIAVHAAIEGAVTGINNVIAKMKATPDAKYVKVKTLTGDAIAALQDLGFKVTQLPDGQFIVEAKTGTAKSNIEKLQAARDALKGKNITLSGKDLASATVAAIKAAVKNLTGKDITITATYRTVFETIGHAPSTTADALRKQAERLNHTASGGKAGSNMRLFAGGGSVSGAVIEGPGTTTSDSIPARLSRGEFVMRAAAVRKYGSNFMQRLNQGLLHLPGFARGGKVSKAQKRARALAKSEREAANEARGDLTISHFGRMAGYKNDEFRHALGLPEALGGLVDSLNHWRSVILKATHGGLEKHLLKQLDRAGKSLIKYEKKLSKVNDSLDKAKTKLSDLKQAAASLRDSVTSNVMSATDITRVSQGDKNVTMSDVMTGMKESVDKSSAFSDALTALKKRGVSGTIIQQIAEAGISGGGLETAGALLGASDSEIKTLNDMQKQINANAKKSGKTAADAMYAAGIKAAQGLVDGLKKKKKSIEKAMMDIAKAMEKAIKKALKIHSPSKVMEKVGHYTAEGFAVGIKKNRTVDTAWTSMLNTGGTGGYSSPGTAGSSGQQVIQVCIGNRVIDEIILDSSRRVVRTRGGNVQAVFGRK
jgi:hypothetical protein